MDDVIGILESEWTARRARVLVAKGSNRFVEADDQEADPKNQIYIADMGRDPTTGTATLLINRGDPDALGPAYIEIAPNAVAGKIRSTTATANETPGWSAHLVLSLTPKGGVYRACFEQMPKVSSSLVETALNRIIAQAIKGNPHYAFEHVTKAKGRSKLSRKPYAPILSAERVPTENASDDLKNAELSQVTFTRKLTQYSGVGSAEIIEYMEEKLVIHTKPVGEDQMIRGLKNLLNQAKDEGFSKVTFGIHKLPGGATSNPTLDLDMEDALEKLYVRAKRLSEFGEVLLSCYPKINFAIQSKMIEVVASPGNW
ncbi:hypothetical protein [Brevundimonas subvibrioides]|uniref:hypothetical protein n=1 Tax=Brevundimonas subvibrioides TaxID=74313 RepID=UPI0022B57903|nr:hypothetical protein [Brevundimonas subvibrioides]